MGGGGQWIGKVCKGLYLNSDVYGYFLDQTRTSPKHLQNF